MLHFHIVSLFPESIEPYLSGSIIGRAREGIAPKGKKNGKPLIKVSYYNPKDFSKDKFGRVDRRPYGGGPGMVLEPDAMLRAATAAIQKTETRKSRGEPSGRRRRPAIIFFSTEGKLFDEEMAKKLAKKKDIVFISGKYEGVDARVRKILKAEEVSVGPYVLTGGELPAATMIDAIARFVPGVLGKAESLERSRVSSPEVYTRPEVLVWKGKKHRVPEVLLSGNHAEIEKWKKKLT
jgi:tRNA (guanine37-N1)-methyltransferase